ncbi:DNA polymerase III subunit gamma/tau [Campylobacter curvus]|uniref:DNA polymerase III subunit gamma/tau n=1 Tax=Campylobacter curvus TaxID=200 RepID=UPI0014705777|nr:DNA polymerase III subunit gamma/tau [Campylobacter curvus]MBN7288583.1 DNA polymerase III subunit gamma/tau [Campylobacter curvus]
MQALALKYRPKNFDELIGQEAVSKSLTHALDEGRISHAYLFSGLRGSGKTSSARIFSKALVCEKGPTSRPCETCPQCIMANESRHMDIIEMDAASHRKIDDIRELIEQTKYKPAMARYKIFIIDEVHMLTKEAFNALLKTLEEPPSYVKFILATTDPLKLPATVLSRTQHFRFKQIGKNSITKHLEFILSKESISYEREALEILARSGRGSLRDTLTLLDQAIIYGANNITQSSVASMLGLLDPSRIEQILNLVMLSDKEGLRELVAELEIYEPEMIIDELIANLKQKFIDNDPKFSLLIYERFFRILAQAKSMLNVSSDNGFVLSIMLFMMVEALNLKSIDEVIESAQHAEQARPSQATTPSAPQQIARPKAQSPYESFVAKIYDRDYSLGEFFKEHVEFVDFKNNELSLIVNANDEKMAFFRKNWKIVNEILHLLFGKEAKIINAKKDEAKPNLEANAPKQAQKDENLSPKADATPAMRNDLNLDEELLKSKPAQASIAPKPKPTEPQEMIAAINFNSSKSPQEMEKIKQEAVIREANKLFGEPTIVKAEP